MGILEPGPRNSAAWKSLYCSIMQVVYGGVSRLMEVSAVFLMFWCSFCCILSLSVYLFHCATISWWIKLLISPIQPHAGTSIPIHGGLSLCPVKNRGGYISCTDLFVTPSFIVSFVSFLPFFLIWGDTRSLRMPALRPASQAGPMRNPKEGTSVVLHDTTRLTCWCV